MLEKTCATWIKLATPVAFYSVSILESHPKSREVLECAVVSDPAPFLPPIARDDHFARRSNELMHKTVIHRLKLRLHYTNTLRSRLCPVVLAPIAHKTSSSPLRWPDRRFNARRVGSSPSFRIWKPQ